MKFVSRRTFGSAVLMGAAAWLLISTFTRDSDTAQTAASDVVSSSPTSGNEAADIVQGAQPIKAALPSTVRTSSPAETRLLEIYRLIANAQTNLALAKAEQLTREHPNFQLAQLVYGDLLLAKSQGISKLGDVPSAQASKAASRIEQLQIEAQRRLDAFVSRPAPDTFPTQFVSLPSTTKHAIAVDASRSRLYLFENGSKGLRLVADYYASVGKLGTDKSIEGDQRTPLGVYYITSRLDPKQLTDFYGAGALPINYPNEHDRRLGRTGSGIWLHGVPGDSYARSPESTDGCVALANPELQRILDQVQPRTTPVVIARSLQWVTPKQAEPLKQTLTNLIEGWRVARMSGDLDRIMSFYSPQFKSGKRDLAGWRTWVEQANRIERGKRITLKELAILNWQDRGDLLVVTFGEVVEGQRTGKLKRQYWGKEGGLWKIFYEGVIG